MHALDGNENKAEFTKHEEILEAVQERAIRRNLAKLEDE